MKLLLTATPGYQSFSVPRGMLLEILRLHTGEVVTLVYQTGDPLSEFCEAMAKEQAHVGFEVEEVHSAERALRKREDIASVFAFIENGAERWAVDELLKAADSWGTLYLTQAHPRFSH